MASFKRSAGSDFERCASTKKACVAPPTDFDPDQGIAIRVKPSPTPRSHAMLTRRITTRQSTAAVLDTYELLEAILHELPMEKILEVRQVSKSWDSLVKNSKPLRTKLFLEAEPRTCLWSLDRATLKLRPYEWGSREKMGEAWMQTQFLSRPSIANPLLFSHDPILRSPLAIRALTCEGLHFTASPDLAKKRSIVHEMFVTQPRVSVVQFRFYFRASKEGSTPYSAADGFKTVRIVKKEGVRLGHILTAFKIEASKSPQYRPSSKLSIKVQSSSPARKSVIWMLGAVFVSDEEKELVERMREDTVSKRSAEEPGWVEKILCMEA